MHCVTDTVTIVYNTVDMHPAEWLKVATCDLRLAPCRRDSSQCIPLRLRCRTYIFSRLVVAILYSTPVLFHQRKTVVILDAHSPFQDWIESTTSPFTVSTVLWLCISEVQCIVDCMDSCFGFARRNRGRTSRNLEISEYEWYCLCVVCTRSRTSSLYYSTKRRQ
jgi:hypothetical protein